MDIIEVKNLSFSYNGEETLKDISFTVKSGDFTGVLGPNGGGKTTLIKAILGLLPSEKGRIKLFGRDLKHFKDWQKIGYLEQKATPPKLMPLTAFDVARLGLLSSKKMPRIFNAEDNRRTLAVMETTKCLEYKDKLFNELSGGQQQRVLMARTLVNNPALIILDEPSTALDGSSRDSLFEMISRINKNSNTAVLVITHDIADIGKYVNNFIIVDKKLIFSGDKHNFCRSKKVTDYFGPYTPHLMDHLHSEGYCPFAEEYKYERH
ncbi:MAG: metal ABC transporter ATP-binding protein [Elusimicrobiaceae bacterium]